MIINAGIQRVVYGEGYADELSSDMIKQAGIVITKCGREAQ
jgi:deoxycytidylate deaminase